MTELTGSGAATDGAAGSWPAALAVAATATARDSAGAEGSTSRKVVAAATSGSAGSSKRTMRGARWKSSRAKLAARRNQDCRRGSTMIASDSVFAAADDERSA